MDITEETPLSAKEALFVNAIFTEEGNQTAAAIAAGYSPKSARQQASRLLTKANIQRALRERIEAANMEADETLRRLIEQARGSMADFISIDGEGLPMLNFKRAKQLGRLHLIKRFKHVHEVKTFGAGDEASETVKDTYEVELYDAQAALTLLGKHHKLFDRALESDWRAELERAGLNPDDQLNQLADQFVEHIRRGAKGDDGGSAGAGETAAGDGAGA